VKIKGKAANDDIELEMLMEYLTEEELEPVTDAGGQGRSAHDEERHVGTQPCT